MLSGWLQSQVQLAQDLTSLRWPLSSLRRISLSSGPYQMSFRLLSFRLPTLDDQLQSTQQMVTSPLAATDDM